jgi:hypothetical protein
MQLLLVNRAINRKELWTKDDLEELPDEEKAILAKL